MNKSTIWEHGSNHEMRRLLRSKIYLVAALCISGIWVGALIASGMYVYNDPVARAILLLDVAIWCEGAALLVCVLLCGCLVGWIISVGRKS